MLNLVHSSGVCVCVCVFNHSDISVDNRLERHTSRTRETSQEVVVVV